MSGRSLGIAAILVSGLLGASQPGPAAPPAGLTYVLVDSGHGGTGHSEGEGRGASSGDTGRSHEATEAGDDRGGSGGVETGDDRGGTPGAEPGDDSGGAGTVDDDTADGHASPVPQVNVLAENMWF